MPVKYESRKYIDLILRLTSKWANWDPPKQIRIGDYGIINRDTGEFEYEGNIFSDAFRPTAAQLGVDLQELKPQMENEEIEIIVTSKGVSATKVDLSPSVGVQNVAAASLRIQLQCGETRGAALIVYKPQFWTLPRDEGLYKLLKERPDRLDGKYIVTDVVKCPAYVLYLSSKQSESFEVNLGTDLPMVPNVNIGGRTGTIHNQSASTGFLRRANGTDATYIPLFKLKQPPAWFWKWVPYRRGEALRKEDFSSFEEALPPWKWLDDDGEEQEYYDPVDTWSDDDDE